MKLSELIRHFSFDAIIPELVAQDPKSATQLAWYKEAYDTLRETKPADEGWEIEVIRCRDEYDDGSSQEYVHARHCEGQPWEGCLASEVIIKDHIPEISAVARILWGMTFYGYTKEERENVFNDEPQNVYERKAEALRNRQFRNYAYGLAGSFELKHRSLTMEDWEIFHRRKAKRNRAKRMRDARQERSIARLERSGKVQVAINRFPISSSEDLEYLFNTHQILELNFASHVPQVGERAAYLAELLTRYYTGDLTPYSRCEVLMTTSQEHPVSADELSTIKAALSTKLSSVIDIHYHTAVNNAHSPNIILFIVFSR
ncbi:MAG: hypothetical protein II791_02350 [Bacteroidales bacterium]|nr:hypothetical protein [Bacteroidales bacterium]